MESVGCNDASIMVNVQLPAGVVRQLDEIVNAGFANTRAELVWQALEREFRWVAALKDAQLLAECATNSPVDYELPAPRFASVENGVAETIVFKVAPRRARVE